MKLSIIVPVYNMAADGKLEYCLESLINQTIEDYEIIAVNDASTDNSLEILKAYEAKYPDRFKVVTYTVNKRQGGAKNEGLKVAKGEWIGFIDSDDWISSDYYEKLINKALETGADVVGCDYSLVHEHTYEVGQVVKNNKVEQCGVFDVDKRKNYLRESGSMVTKVYRGSMIRENKLTFPEGIFYEDNCAGPIWTMYVNRFEYIEEPMYYYYQHDTSTVHEITKSKCLDRMAASETMVNELKKRGFFEEYKDVIEDNFTRMFFVNTLFSYMLMRKGKKYSFVKNMKKKMIEYFPDFRSNPSYGRFMDEEQKKYVDLLMKNSFVFYVKYSLLWKYRRLRKSISH